MTKLVGVGGGADVHVAKLKLRLDKKYLFRILTLNLKSL